VALAALLILSLLASTASAARKPAGKLRSPSCGTVADAAKRGDDLTIVQITRAQGISCKQARTVVIKCNDGRLGRAWETTSPETETVLGNGRRAVFYDTISGPQLRCEDDNQPKGLGAGLGQARATGEFGPFEGPLMYPNKWPSPSGMVYDWTNEVGTYLASTANTSVGSVSISGKVHNPSGDVRSVWFEYGQTRDLGTTTERQPPRVAGDDSPVGFDARLLHLRARTRYWWRAMANVDLGPRTQVFEGVLGSFVTNPYPKIANAARPCQSAPPMQYGQPWELTESLAIVCSGPQHMEKGACFPSCNNFFSGRLKCSKEFPRNLNAGEWSFNVPKIDYQVNVNKLVNYWRSNDSNRFIEAFGKNANSAGGEVGPTPGWHDWDVAQWAYPFTDTATDAEFWINCTERWGTVVDADALAQGQGNDTASTTPPGKPQNLRVRTAADGGIDVDWDAPSTASPSGLAGYYVTLFAWKPNEPKAYPAQGSTPLTTMVTRGRISPRALTFYKQYLPAGTDLYVMVAALSREGSHSELATLPVPR
jgi:hypothetical protein